MASATTFFDFKPKDKKGAPYDLSKLNGKVVLVVNTASKCGFTPQFEGLEKLYKEIKGKYPNDFEIIGFPCNQFGGQDPGSNDEIQEFCQINYGVSFLVLGKIDVNGAQADPAFEWLKNEKPGLMGLKRVKWNFEKFLVGRDGKVKVAVHDCGLMYSPQAYILPLHRLNNADVPSIDVTQKPRSYGLQS
ncbi:hypothetical protein ACET3X_002380 [Alternaria dauci]|uniref:Glutathione peroxidase n=1 Tax=Alternaria dauci TaxID=48095 RepID=A0ABR3UQK9_9PLEO